MTDNPLQEWPFLMTLPIELRVAQSLAQHFKRLTVGSKVAVQTPLVKEKYGQTPNFILNEWDIIYNSIKGERVNDVLHEIEMSNRAKFGPRSYCKPWVDRIDSVSEYFEKRSQNLYKMHDTLDKVLFKFEGSPRLRPISIEKAITFLKDGTNSGLPFNVKKGKIKHKLLINLDSIPDDLPCILFTRTQEGNKTRNVWGYPAKITLLETRFYQPLLNFQRDNSYWRGALLSAEETDRRISRIMNVLKRNLSDHCIISIDFSAFDASVQPFMINLAFDFIKTLFQPEYGEDIEYLKRLFMTIPLLTPEGIFRGVHGVPSGSTFTNEVDSIVQYLVAISTGLVLGVHLQIQGDDGLYLIKDSDVNDFLARFTSVGLQVNKSKTVIAKDHCTFCQKLYHFDYVNEDGTYSGIYPVYRALNRLIYQERWVNFKAYGLGGIDYYSLRAIAILENCKYHPLFEDFVRFVLSLDKSKLSFNPESLGKYCQLLKEGKGSGWTHSTQYGDSLKGLKSFKTIEVINRILAES